MSRGEDAIVTEVADVRRRLAVLLPALGCVLILVLAYLFGPAADPPVFDEAVWAAAIELRSPGLTAVLTAWTHLGSTAVLAVLGVAGVVLLLVKQRRRDALWLAVVSAGGGLLVLAAKHLVRRERPPLADRLADESTWSFPSGHSLGSTVILGALVVLILRTGRSGARIWFAVLTGLCWLGIGLSRIYLGVHWATDVLAGWALGGLWLVAAVGILSLRPTSGARNSGSTQP